MLSNMISTTVLAISLVFVSNAVLAESIIEVDSKVDIADYYKKIGFFDLIANPERLQSVPRTRLYRVPKQVSKEWVENISLRKSLFFQIGTIRNPSGQ